jgi:hypothetical protein
MKRSLISVLVLFSALGLIADSASAKPKPTPCPGVFEISDCPDEGCGNGFDPELNKRKNIRIDPGGNATLQTFAWMKKLKTPPKNEFCTDRDRSVLQELGEGQKITVVAWALAARAEGPETCNCKLGLPADTDNHIVLVNPDLKNPTLTASEKQSETAEFTPRVRLDHPKFTQERLESLIDPEWSPPAKPANGKLLVRVTGLLMFDSEHYCGPFQLNRKNDWEIHPVLKMEYCPEEQTCQADSDENWQNLEDE